jgi:hypothetical protein
MDTKFVNKAGAARILGMTKTRLDRLYRAGLMPPVAGYLLGQPVWREEIIRTFALAGSINRRLVRAS